MTPRQAKFVAEYVRTGNATQSAIAAGYVPTNADVTGPRLLRNVAIKQALETVAGTAVAQVEAKLEEAVGTEAWIIEKAAEVVNRALNAVPVTRMEHGQRVTVDGEWTCDLGAATPALSLLAKRLAAFRDKDDGTREGDKHLHLHGLDESQLRALVNGLRA